MEKLTSLKETSDFLMQPGLNFLYILSPSWSVCHALLPQVEEVLKEYPKIQSKTADIGELPELAGELSIFTSPVLLLFSEGSELLREARFVHLQEFERKIAKMHQIYFE